MSILPFTITLAGLGMLAFALGLVYFSCSDTPDPDSQRIIDELERLRRHYEATGE